MDILKAVLNAREDRSPQVPCGLLAIACVVCRCKALADTKKGSTHLQVQALLDALDDPAFNLQVCICSVGENHITPVQCNALSAASPHVILVTCSSRGAVQCHTCICPPASGGVGSTELSNFLTQAGLSCNLLTDQDAVRHVNRQVQQLNTDHMSPQSPGLTSVYSVSTAVSVPSTPELPHAPPAVSDSDSY